MCKGEKNILISGGTGSGKTTLLNVLASFIPNGERVITIEDAAELKLDHDHLISLEARPGNNEGKGSIHIRDLVKNSLRMRPDRIVIGECRGTEALDMLQAMNTGHEGSLTTLHAYTARCNCTVRDHDYDGWHGFTFECNSGANCISCRYFNSAVALFMWIKENYPYH